MCLITITGFLLWRETHDSKNPNAQGLTLLSNLPVGQMEMVVYSYLFNAVL